MVRSSEMKVLRILLAEDDRAQRDYYAMKLQQDGHTLIWATSALKTIDLLLNEPPVDLALIDFELEGSLNGIDVARWISRAAEKADRPPPIVILLTGHSREELVDRITTDPFYGVTRVFFKGQDDFAELWDVIDKLADK